MIETYSMEEMGDSCNTITDYKNRNCINFAPHLLSLCVLFLSKNSNIGFDYNIYI